MADLTPTNSVPPVAGNAQQPNPIETAPKDGTIIRLLIDWTGSDGWSPLTDDMRSWTIGGNTLDHTGEDVWQYVGWNWSQDCFVDLRIDDGAPVPIGWLPLDTTVADETLRAEIGTQGPCAGCGKRKPLPLKRDEMNGYVCLSCVDKALDRFVAEDEARAEAEAFAQPLPEGRQAKQVERYRIEHDGFVGTLIGRYTRLDGKRGVVLQQDGTMVVHVYGEKWLVPVLAHDGLPEARP